MQLNEDQIIDIVTVKPVTALQFILSMRPCVPMSQERTGEASNGEVRRWLDSSAILINGKRPKSKDVIQFPVTELVYFPKSQKNRVTVF